jgi:hypothetical protein
MWQIIFYISVPLVMFLLCLLQDRQMEENLKFLIQYRRIQDDSKKEKAKIS